VNIVLTGPMGSGKTTIGQKVASAFDMKFIDTDALIVKKYGMSINEIFARYGESSFRRSEEQVIADVSKFNNCVIATGGGVVLNPVNMRRLRLNSITINLRISFEMLHERIKDEKDRPLLNQGNFKDELKEYSEGRSSFYQNADFIIDIDNIEMEDIVERIISITKLPQIRICGCISGDNPSQQIKQAVKLGASLVEFRFDLISNPEISSLIQTSSLPVIATDRKNKNNLIKAIEEGSNFVDVEIESPQRDEIIKKAREYDCKVIVSVHDFEKTPELLSFDKGKADILKIATKINTIEDSKRLLNLLQVKNDLIVVGMGDSGSYTRIIAPLLGSYLTYASIHQNIAPGQLDLKTIHGLYRGMGLR
jgi:shikimate kinase